MTGDHGAAMLLAISALATAWSSYQASVWGGVQAAQYTLSFVLRGKASTANQDAVRMRLLDLILFTKWLEAEADQRSRLATLYESHFRPEFRTAFDAWVTDSGRHENSTPFERTEYQSAKLREADRLEAAAARALQAGQHANGLSDEYVFTTVVFATVLFFAGAVRPLVAPPMRTFMLVLATALCLWAVLHVIRLPVAR